MSLPRSNRKTLGFLLSATVFLIVAALFLLLPIRGVNLTQSTAGWTAQGCFATTALYPGTFFDRQISAHERQGVTLWGSYCTSDADTGELRSAIFPAPKILELFVAGYLGRPDRPGLKLFLERQDNHQLIPLPSRRQPGVRWVKLHWWLPQDVRNQPVRLVAVDQETGSGGWLAVANPRSLSVTNFYRQQLKSWVKTTETYLFQLALFLLPGFAAACALTVKRTSAFAPIYLVIIVVVTGATLGYLAFWEFFFSKGLGQFCSFAVYLISAAVLITPKLTPRSVIKATLIRIREPFLWATLAGLCYTSFYFAFSDPFERDVWYASDRFFADILPADNVIPAIFADRIYDRKPVRPFCCGDWLSSDRPPLQTGIVLMERPLALMENTETRYHLLGTALQCCWICGVWCLLTALGTQRKYFRPVIGFLIFSGFLFYNSVYVWPKMLAATCILFLFSVLIALTRDNRALTYFENALAAICLGCALMSHPGSVFSLAALGVLLIRIRRLIAIRQAVLALVIVIAFYAPWTAYQKYVDPPGNRLLKMHLGGIVPIDSRTTWQAIRDSYQSHNLNQIIFCKWLNVVYLAGEDLLNSYGLTAWRGPHIDHAATEHSRNMQRFYMWNAVGLANVGWLAALFFLIKRRHVTLAIPYAGWLVAAAIINLVFWSFITFGPYETQTAHSSYADILLLSVGLSGFILTLPRVFYLLLFAWQLFNFFVVWVWSLPARIAQPITFQLPMIAAGVALTLTLIYLTLKAEPEQPMDSLPSS